MANSNGITSLVKKRRNPLVKKSKDGKRPGYNAVWDWVVDKAADAVGYYAENKDVIDTIVKGGTSAIKGYMDYKDAKRRNELEEKAYDDYMAAAEAAGQEARAAIDLNLTPMLVSNIPTTKADVTDYTAATGLKHGGISGLRKKYAEGMDEFEVEEMDEEVITPEYLMKEEGVEIGPMASGKYTQEEIEAYENYKYEMNEQKPGFPIMEIDEFLRFWYSTVKGKEKMKMASAPSIEDSQNDAAMQLFNKPYDQLNEMELEMFQEEMLRLQSKFMAKGGIAGLRKKYAVGTDEVEVMEMEEEPLGDFELKQEEGVPIGPMAGPDWYIKRIEHLEFLGYDYEEASEIAFDDDKYYSIVGMESAVPRGGDPEQPPIYLPKPGDAPMKMAAKGGRIKKANGGIMDLGGLEKDYRFSGGFVPIGEYEKKDDVPARLSKNEFVFTADAVRAAGGGSINKGAKRMYNVMKNLEARPEAKRMTA